MNETISERLAALRVQMKQSGLNAALIPQTDPHQSEYIADHWQAAGSAGSPVRPAHLW